MTVTDEVTNSQEKGFLDRSDSTFDSKQSSKIVSLASLVSNNYFVYIITLQQSYQCLQFRYATSLDVLLMLIGTIAGLAHGVSLPLIILVFGDMMNAFTDRTAQLCTLNYTSLSIEICPPGYHLTQTNFFSSFL